MSLGELSLHDTGVLPGSYSICNLNYFTYNEVGEFYVNTSNDCSGGDCSGGDGGDNGGIVIDPSDLSTNAYRYDLNEGQYYTIAELIGMPEGQVDTESIYFFDAYMPYNTSILNVSSDKIEFYTEMLESGNVSLFGYNSSEIESLLNTSYVNGDVNAIVLNEPNSQDLYINPLKIVRVSLNDVSYSDLSTFLNNITVNRDNFKSSFGDFSISGTLAKNSDFMEYSLNGQPEYTIYSSKDFAQSIGKGEAVQQFTLGFHKTHYV